ncbi:hypothetical protein F511_14868 [Dorcoceras hygrometricum]|uniref:Uncharacterized protein n=1 Tax=Dorcoceras hygrometricum TaxID=472368 RepID=A0A2Z7AK49_9LAMI|nr:hypothetical protein F511_14868 [Dorcoceras hygrometricum]
MESDYGIGAVISRTTSQIPVLPIKPELDSDSTSIADALESSSYVTIHQKKMQRKNKKWPRDDQYNSIKQQAMTFIGCLDDYLAATRAWLQPELQERRLFTVGGDRSVNQLAGASPASGGGGGDKRRRRREGRRGRAKAFA